MAKIAARNETGRPIATQNDTRSPKKSHMVSSTSANPWTPLTAMMRSRSRMLEVESCEIANSTLPGASAWAAAIWRSSAAMTVSASWVSVLLTATMAARRPLK